MYSPMMEFKFSEVQSIVRAAFPGAKSQRLVRVRSATTCRVMNYWDGGCRTESVVMSVKTGRMISYDQAGFVQQTQGNPFGVLMGEIPMTPEIFVVEHVIFCGKDMGYRIVFHPSKEDMPQNFAKMSG